MQTGIIDMAHLFGWRVAHFRPVKTPTGYRTPVQADGAGFPDLVLARNGVVLFRELKIGTRVLDYAQRDWQTALGEHAGIWRDSDYPDNIRRELLAMQ